MRRTLVIMAITGLVAASASAQVTPAAGSTPPDDTPKISTGLTLFADYTYQSSPTVTDSGGNTIHPNSFNIARSYINFNGQVSHLVAFRVTPDIFTDASGNYTFRIKYAFAQINLDDWMTKGSWVRFGQQQTPWIDYEEGIYRYRFQGPVFVDREGFLTSSDKGASFHYNLPMNYGDLHVGVYNGEGYSHVEANNQKAFQVRFSVRPFAQQMPAARGLRVSVFYDGDNYISNAERSRFIANATFEHKYLNAGFDYLHAKDQKTALATSLTGNGFSLWVNPRSTVGVEALFRYDQLTPNNTLDTQKRKRVIAGIAYWFPHMGGPTAALLLDYDHTNFDNFSPSQPAQNKIAVHGLVNF